MNTVNKVSVQLGPLMLTLLPLNVVILPLKKFDDITSNVVLSTSIRLQRWSEWPLSQFLNSFTMQFFTTK